MNLIWKRTLCLVLSAVLLMSSVPMAALATEGTTTETQAVEPQPVEEQIVEEQSLEPQATTEPAQTVTEPNQAATEPVQPAEEPKLEAVTGEAANSQEGIVPRDVAPLLINGKKPGELDLENVTVDEAGTKLKLGGTDKIKSIVAHGISLTIELSGANVINAEEAVAITTDRDLTITGDGSLEVTTKNATAVSVAGSVEGENKKGLVIDGVQISVEVDAETENPVGVASANGVIIKRNAHFKTSHSQSTDEYVMECDGYCNSETYTADEKKTGGSALEFVAGEHIDDGTWRSNATNHYHSCKGECPFDAKIDLAPHVAQTLATCEAAAICSGCNLSYGAPDYSNHTAYNEETTQTEHEGGKHWKVHTVCSKIIGAESTCVYDDYSCEGAKIIGICECGDSKTLFEIKAPEVPEGKELTWDGTDKEATTAYKSEDLNESDPVIRYYGYTDGERNTEPMADGQYPRDPGKYLAMVDLTTFGDTEDPKVEFEILKKPLADTMIQLEGDEKEYQPGAPSRTEPSFTVVDKDIQVDGQDKSLSREQDYTVRYYRGENGDQLTEDYTKPGKITVKITAKESSDYYTGEAKASYMIAKADVADNAFEPLLPEAGNNPVYDGRKKQLGYKATNNGLVDENMGTPVVEFYESESAQEQVDAIDAGTYIVKIRVPGNDYYNEAVLKGSSAWTLTIDPARDYTDATVKTQTIKSADEFQWPKFTGVTRDGATEAEQVEMEKIKYTCDDTEIAKSALEDKLKNMKNGDTLTIGYTATPKTDGNYLETVTKSDAIQVTLAKLVFKNGNTAYESEAALGQAIVKTGTITYGDTDIVNTTNLSAQFGNAEDKDTSHFTVKYAMKKGDTYDEANLLTKPNAGKAKFIVYYNAKLNNTDFEDKVAAYGEIVVAPKDSSKNNVITPKKKELTESEGKNKELQELVTPGKDGTISLEYSLDGVTYSTEVPKASAPGMYRVYYRSPENANYTTPVEGYVDSVIKPYLTATFGDTLKNVKLPDGGEWTWQLNGKKLEEMAVGNAGVNTSYKLDYNSKTINGLTGEFTAAIHVAPKAINVKIALKEDDKHMPYKEGAAVKASVTVTNLDGNKTLTKDVDYELDYDNETKRGSATVTVKSKGNYTFTTSPLEYVIYDVAAVSLTDTTAFTGSDVATKTGKDVKEALDEKFSEDYSETLRKYTYFMMEVDNPGSTDKKYSFEDFYWPEDGIALAINYPTNSHKEDGEYKVFAMYLVGEKAGTVIELEETTGTLGMNQFKKGESSFSVKMDNYMAICIAEKVDPDATYKVDTSASNGKVEFTIGSDTTKKTKADAVKVGEKLTITATPDTNYALTKVQYIYKDGSTSKAKEIKQNDDGKYVLEMPSMDITIKATFSKKTTSTKNPYSGDTSNITLWLTILVASGVGIAALMAFWFRKRRK